MTHPRKTNPIHPGCAGHPKTVREQIIALREYRGLPAEAIAPIVSLRPAQVAGVLFRAGCYGSRDESRKARGSDGR